jgi:hypothetical protein
VRDRHILEHILSLPNEVQCLILLQLSISDLLALRRASRSLKSLVDDECSSAIVRDYARYLPPLFTKLYPTPAPGEASFQWILEIQHRLNVSLHVSILVADFFWQDCLRIGPYNRRRTKYRPIYECMVANFVPFFFTLAHFFENYRRMILERAVKHCRTGHVFAISTGGGTLWDDQISILEQYDLELMLDCYHVYGYLLHVLERQLHPPRLDKILRTLKRAKAEPASTGEIEILLMLGGMEQVRRVLSKRNWSSRRQTLDTFIHNLKPVASSDWTNTWRDLHVESDVIKLDRIHNLRLTLPALHLIWVPSVLKLLVANKSIDRIDFGQEYVHGGGRHVQTPVDFICGLLKNRDDNDDDDDDDDDEDSDSDQETDDENREDEDSEEDDASDGYF